MICDQLPATLLLPALAGQPTKNERPHHPPSGHPERHLAADATADAERRDKQGCPHPPNQPRSGRKPHTPRADRRIKEPWRAPNPLCSRQLTGPSRLPLRAGLRPGLDRPAFAPHGALNRRAPIHLHDHDWTGPRVLTAPRPTDKQGSAAVALGRRRSGLRRRAATRRSPRSRPASVPAAAATSAASPPPAIC